MNSRMKMSNSKRKDLITGKWFLFKFHKILFNYLLAKVIFSSDEKKSRLVHPNLMQVTPIEIVQERQRFGDLLLRLETLHVILSYLNDNDLEALEIYFSTESLPVQYFKRFIDTAANTAFDDAVTEQKQFTPRNIHEIHQNQRIHLPCNTIKKLIKSHNNASPIRLYRNIRFGPSRRIKFDRFAGSAFYCNKTSDLVYQHKSCGCSAGIATTNYDQVMNQGQRYVSFLFHNCNGMNTNVAFEIGVMRHLSNEWWYKNHYKGMLNQPSRLVLPDLRKQFQLSS